VPYKASKKFPHFADLKGILTQSKNTDNALYQTVQEVIERLGVMKILTEENLVAINDQINTIIGAIGSIPPPVAGMNLDYLGDFVSGPVYNDGDIVVGADGVLYMCVVDGTTTPPEPFPTTPPAAHAPTHNTGGTDPISAISGNIITTGTVADARHSTNVALLDRNPQTFSGFNSFTPGIKERGRTTAIGEWTNFIPAWTSTGVQPAIGNGTLAGRYTLIGKTCIFNVGLTPGSTTNLGTGVWIFGLPFQALVSSVGMAAPALLQDVGTRTYNGVVIMFADGLRVLIQADAGQVGPTVPFTWVSGDNLSYGATYEIL
jgi:hypothetical protein